MVKKQEIEKSLKEKKEELKVLEEKEKQINKYFIGKYLKCLIIFTFNLFRYLPQDLFLEFGD